MEKRVKNSFGDSSSPLLAEWSKNNSVSPCSVYKSNKVDKFLWVCPVCKEEYPTTINSRYYQHTGCPYCSHMLAIPGKTDFATVFPDLLKDWDSEKNVGLDPTSLLPQSEKIVNWKCHHCGYEWQTPLYYRTGKDKTGCPKCKAYYKWSMREIAAYYYLDQAFPESIHSYKPEWMENNSEIDIYIPSKQYGIEYDGRMWHKEEKDKKKNEICLKHGITILRLREPGLNKISEKDIQLDTLSWPSLTKGIKELLGQLCNTSVDVDVQRDFPHILSFFGKDKVENSLMETHKEIAMEWDYSMNGEVTPAMVRSGSGKTVYWVCTETYMHSYPARIDHRTGMGSRCPYCFKHKVLKGFNDFESQHQELLKEWDYKKNVIRPDELYERSTTPVWWKCQKCDYEWKKSPQYRVDGHGCPKCAKQIRVQTLRENKLKNTKTIAEIMPRLIEEWDYEKNKSITDLTPFTAFPGSCVKVWWKCPDCGYAWEQYIFNRMRSKGCKICRKNSN